MAYTVSIVESTRELTARERIMLKDTSNAIKLDEAAEVEKVVVSPADYAILSVHNDKAQDNPDYTQLIILDRNGTKYVTGSPSFRQNFADIWEEMNGESFEIEVYKLDSKNYKGKKFLTCSIL